MKIGAPSSSEQPIDPQFGGLSADEYTKRINTPAKSTEYYERFHRPLIEEAKTGSRDGNVRVLDIACGHSFELDFVKEDPNVELYGLDLSIDPLIGASRTRLKNVLFTVGDVEYFPFKEGFADAGIALNAVIYKPAEMLKALRHALKMGGKAVVNFRNFSNAKNRAFYEFYLNQGGEILDDKLVVKIGDREEEFNIKVVDYRNCEDEKIRNLDRQIYFENEADIERLITLVGFEISLHSKFEFASPANPNNEIDVYTVKKV